MTKSGPEQPSDGRAKAEVAPESAAVIPEDAEHTLPLPAPVARTRAPRARRGGKSGTSSQVAAATSPAEDAAGPELVASADSLPASEETPVVASVSGELSADSLAAAPAPAVAAAPAPAASAPAVLGPAASARTASEGAMVAAVAEVRAGLTGLLDLGFTRLATPGLVKVVYLLTAIGLAGWWLIGSLSLLAAGSQPPRSDLTTAAGVFALLLGWIPALVLIALVRFVLEFFLVTIRNGERLDEIAARLDSDAAGR